MASSTTTEWRGTSDHNVTETAFDAVKCKLSAVTLGYFQDPFLSFFVEKPTRRIPLIHRGYYLRHVAIARCVELFLSQFMVDILVTSGTVDATSTQVNIVSLGAGFDTLFFRLLEQRQFAGKLSFTEVDCDAIVDAKTKLLNDEDVREGLFPKDMDNLTVASPVDGNVAWQCQVPSASYSLIACDLGDIQRLDTTLTSAGGIASYLVPEKGTMLLRWLAETFSGGSIALYDPIGLEASDSEKAASPNNKTKSKSDAFDSTLQHYFAVKGCTLRGARGYQTAADHANCRILDMNSVFTACTTAEEKRRLASLEPFDEFADWMLCNAHYAIYLADNCSSQDKDWTAMKGQEPVIIRSFQREDLTAFVANRLRGPSGDMFDVHLAFQTPNSTGIMTSGFWVAEVDGKVVGCAGVKPLVTSSNTEEDQRFAELCRLSVAPTVRRRGLASALVRAVEAFTASCGAFNEIRLETIDAMEGAQQLYRSLGYVEQLESEKQHSSFKLQQYTASLTQSNGLTLDLSSLQLTELPPLEELDSTSSSTEHSSECVAFATDGLARAFPQLASLNVSENAPEELSAASIGALRNLQHLNVAHNHIRELPIATFEWLEALEKLDARVNLIEKIKFDNEDGKLQFLCGGDIIQSLVFGVEGGVICVGVCSQID
ncbi:Leucine-rich repeat domain, L domain-like [Phytophthora cactorum]|nr:Leucine-rich repeat domain, L domain-like [Phytophthora cactorum]